MNRLRGACRGEHAEHAAYDEKAFTPERAAEERVGRPRAGLVEDVLEGLFVSSCDVVHVLSHIGGNHGGADHIRQAGTARTHDGVVDDLEAACRLFGNGFAARNGPTHMDSVANPHRSTAARLVPPRAGVWNRDPACAAHCNPSLELECESCWGAPC